MALGSNELQIVVQAKDAASETIRRVKNEIGGFSSEAQASVPRLERFKTGVQNSALALGAMALTAGVALSKLTAGLEESLDAANRQQAALIGLSSVARAFGQDVGGANAAAKRLAKDGLMSLSDAATGLKNLLAAGFNLDQAVVLMNRFKDSAAFGRQGALSFGEAIRGATEGIKNGNSILVDNAGVTKNLSVILEEAGYSAQDLMKATSDAGVRQAIFNGILRETNPMLGDAGRLTETAAGAQARLSAQTDILKARIGAALQPALVAFLNVVTPLIEKVSAWVQENPKLAATLLIAIGVFLAMITIIGGLVAAVAGVIVAFGAAGAAIAGGIAVAIAAVVALAAVVLLNFNAIKERINGLIGKFNELPVAVRAVFGAVGNMILGALGPLGLVLGHLQTIINLANGAARAISSVASGKGVGSVLHDLHVPGFAEGVRNFSGGLAVVGERGPELVELPRGSNVYSNDDSQRIGGGVTINQTNNIYNQADLEMANRELGWRLSAA